MQPSAIIVLVANVLVWGAIGSALGYWYGRRQARAKAVLAMIMDQERQVQISKSWAEGFDPDRIAEIMAEEERRQSY